MTTVTEAARAAAGAPGWPAWWRRCWWGLFRLVLGTVGRLSAGVRVGYRHGFDSGTMLDYVYTNRATGALGVGRLIDRAYLDAVGWRAIRARGQLLADVLRAEITRRGGDAQRDGRPVRILDVAAGPGRYLQEVLLSLPAAERERVRVLCRDLAADGLRRGRELAAAHGLVQIGYQTGDAFDPAPTDHELGGPPDVIVVSGLYELLLDEQVIRESMARLRRLLAPGGALVFTTQVHHPQLELIANVLPNRYGQPWVMTCRPVSHTEQWAREAGFTEVATRAEPLGLFTVTTAG